MKIRLDKRLEYHLLPLGFRGEEISRLALNDHLACKAPFPGAS
jgi:hypothetical protein